MPERETRSAGPAKTCDVLFVYGSELEQYNFGRSHPLKPHRYRLTKLLMEGLGLLDGPGIHVAAPRHATVSELLTVHSYPYLQGVRRAQNIARHKARPTDLSVFGLGSLDNPYFSAIYEAGSLAAGASIQAMEAILEDKTLHAYNMAGGLHHAGRAKAAGFCIFNDPALAIHKALERGARVAYVDLDAHHGDGVQEFFYEDPRVLTISIHESGRYLFPGSGGFDERGAGPGLGTTLNLPLPPRAGNEAFLYALDNIIEPAVRAFQPDVLVTQTGCDTHWSDPLTHLGATLELYPALGRRLHHLSHTVTEGRWLILGGGGYDPVSITPRAWTAFFAAAIEARPFPSELPPAWLDEVASWDVEAPTHLLDDPGPDFETRGAETVRHLEDEFKRSMLPGLRGLRITA
ncbi:MAG: acetoin utilization protein AcuC [Thermoleophilia bacterium]